MRRRDAFDPALLAAPSTLVYAGALLLPLAGVLTLSLHGFDFDKGVLPDLGLDNYRELLSDPLFHEALLRTFRVAILTTAICIAVGVPEAWIIYRVAPRWRGFVRLMVVAPLLVSVVGRNFGWMVLLGGNGLVNATLVALGVPGAPFRLMFTELAVVVGLVHVMVPLVVLSVWASLGRLDPSLERAATNLGAGQLTVLRRVVLPNVMPGVMAGALMVFCLSASAFATPQMLGGNRLRVVSSMTYNEYLNTLDWPLGSALATLLMLAILLTTLLWTRLVEARALRHLGDAAPEVGT